MALPQEVRQKDQRRRFERRGKCETGACGQRPPIVQRPKPNEDGSENQRIVGLVFEHRENELGRQQQHKNPQPSQFGALQRRVQRSAGDAFAKLECADRGGKRHAIPNQIAQPQRHRHERQHQEGEERRISEALIAGLQDLAVPQARGRLRKSLHAGGQFDKARVVSCRGREPDQKPEPRLLNVPLPMRRVHR